MDKIFTCSDLSKFTDTIKIILPYKGYSGAYFFLCEYNGIEFLTKLSFYNKTFPEIYHYKYDSTKNSLAKNEIKVLTLLKEKIIDSNISPCILELIYSKECDSKDLLPDNKFCDSLVKKPPSSKKDKVKAVFCNHKYMVESDLAEPKFAMLVLEQCDVTLHDYMERKTINLELFRAIMFQIVYTLYSIRKIYPGFRHGDLHGDNIMLKIDHNYADKPGYWQFAVEDASGAAITHYLPYFGVTCKIIDFGYATIPEEGVESHIIADKHYQHSRSDNDVLFLLFDIYNFAGKNDDVIKILECLEPNKTFQHYHVNWIKRYSDELPGYQDMLNKPCFDIYRTVDIESDQYILKRFN